ncbi:MAG: hypothetical protein PHH64_00325 [Proteiniphilum sp.]|nr:hypothetical protein [Proteiniphilum sp.]MDD4157844.1 hypothetical protein [Proteiniphilum sp.]MDD4799877.1 hypothetical protein [Proteiniphilum sp.]
MIKSIKRNRGITAMIFLLLLAACSKNSCEQQFSYTFSMESINNFRVELLIHPDSSWQAVRHNFYFDRFGGASSDLQKEGRLTAEEYASFSMLLDRSGMKGMKESYGFDGEESTGNAIVYMLSLTREGSDTHYVTIRENAGDRFSNAFKELILFSGMFLNDKLAEEPVVP